MTPVLIAIVLAVYSAAFTLSLAGWTRRNRKLHEKLRRVEELVDFARCISSGDRAVIYVADLEAALRGKPSVKPHKLGQNEPGDG